MEQLQSLNLAGKATSGQMEYRILVGENTSPQIAELLRGKKITVEHVLEALPGLLSMYLTPPTSTKL